MRKQKEREREGEREDCEKNERDTALKKRTDELHIKAMDLLEPEGGRKTRGTREEKACKSEEQLGKFFCEEVSNGHEARKLFRGMFCSLK